MTEPRNPWKKIDSNRDTSLWEATTAAGVVLRITGDVQPPAWILEHHAIRYTSAALAPEIELGKTGWRIRVPGEGEWRRYGYTPRVLS